MAQITFWRGLSTNLPNSAVDGRIYFCTDTRDFYIGVGNEMKLVHADSDVFAAEIPISDSENNFTSTNVETALAETMATARNAYIAQTMTQAEYVALSESEKNDGTVRYITDYEEEGIEIDTELSDSSINPVSNSAVTASINEIINDLNDKQDILTFDNLPTSGSNNPVKSSGIYSAIQGAVSNIDLSSVSNGAVVHMSTISGGANDNFQTQYVFSQGGTYNSGTQTWDNSTTIGTINIAKDMVATSGQLIYPSQENPIVINNENVTSGTYIAMQIAESDPFYINVASLIEYNTFCNTSEIIFTDNEHTVTANIGEISGSKIIDTTITKSKLTTAIQTSLNLADSAIQSITVTNSEGNNGTITVDGLEVAIKGLGSAAYTNSSSFDSAGSALAVQSALLGNSSTDTVSSKTIEGLTKRADAIDSVLTFDSQPTQSSNNLVKSGAIYSAIETVSNVANNALAPQTLTLAEYEALTEVQKNDGTVRYISDINNNASFSVGTIVLTTSWVETNGVYSQNVTIPGVTATSKIDLQPDLLAVQQLISDRVVSLCAANNNGVVTVYALGSAPSVALNIQYTRIEVSL